jgi:hypothetical protein
MSIPLGHVNETLSIVLVMLGVVNVIFRNLLPSKNRQKVLSDAIAIETGYAKKALSDGPSWYPSVFN